MSHRSATTLQPSPAAGITAAAQPAGTPDPLAGAKNNGETHVQLFATCLVDLFFPQTGAAVVEILESLGVHVEFPRGQTCCGQVAFNAGFAGDARAIARYTVDLLSASDARIVVPSGSCADMIIHRYPELLADDSACVARAREVASRTYEFTQFLADVLRVKCLPRDGARRIVYQPCCHGFRSLGINAQPLRLLDDCTRHGASVLASGGECCGFGGMFAVRASTISGALLDRKLDDIARSGADVVAVTDVSCLMHISGGLRRRGSRVQVKHVADLLREVGCAVQMSASGIDPR